MKIDRNTAPYYDDFDSVKNFHQILFKPGYPVQARELSQSQSIIRDQISKFGDHIFKHGSMVLPGNISYDLNICSVKLVSPIALTNVFIGGDVVGSSGLRGRIKAFALDAGDPLTMFVSYYNTGTAGEKVFGNSETLTLKNVAGNITLINTTAASVACTGAVMAFINDGVFYINGSFVQVSKQSIVISKYSSDANCRVLLKIEEKIIDSDNDVSLLDPGQGSYNFSAPGADRIKISLTLTTLPLSSAVTEDYVEVLRFEDGSIQEFSRYPKYSELEKSLARRTHDESGDYIADGLELSVNESIKKKLNGGLVSGGSTDDYAILVQPGKAYINGFEAELTSAQILTAPKGRSSTPNHIRGKTISIAPNYGQYILVTNLKNLPSFAARASVNLFNAIATGAGAQIGTATVVAIDLHEANSTDQTNIYRLYLTNLSGTADLANIGSVQFSGGSMDVVHRMLVPIQGVDFANNEVVSSLTNVATVLKWTRSTSTLYVTKHTTAPIPAVGVRITGATSAAVGVVNASVYLNTGLLSSPIVVLPTDATFKVRQNIGTAASPVYSSNITYKVFKEISVTMNAGSGSATISGGTIDPIEVGNAMVISATAVLPNSSLSLSSDGLTITHTGAGVNGSTIKIVVAVTKTAVQNKTKTLVSNLGTPDAGLVASARVALTRADIYRIISVVSTVDGDVTSRYALNTGQTDYAYLPGFMILTGALPSGTLTATYEYFSHSGTGDYFSVDSYVSSGLLNFYTTMNVYKSAADSKEYDLRNCLDFRPKFDSYGVSATEMPIIDARITTEVQYYVPRIDSIMFNKAGRAYIDYGVPEETPKAPAISDEAVQLGTIFVPAYTYSVSDMRITPSLFKGYKMRDIMRLEDRVFNIEQYSLLTQTETNLINNDIIDASTGLSRFKSGYLVESFTDAEVIGDVTNVSFRATIDGGQLRPALERFAVSLELLSTTGVTLTNTVNSTRFVMLPYTTSIFAEQTKSSRVTNINPFAVFSWKGKLILQPSIDEFREVFVLPPVYETIVDVVIQTNVVTIQRPWNWFPGAPDSRFPPAQPWFGLFS